MGVRVYTLRMPITSTSPLILGRSTRLLIDCSRMFRDDQKAQGEAEMSTLLAWVSKYPRRAEVQVVLGGYRNGNASRKLQSRLQALGCTVIARHKARA